MTGPAISSVYDLWRVTNEALFMIRVKTLCEWGRHDVEENGIPVAIRGCSIAQRAAVQQVGDL